MQPVHSSIAGSSRSVNFPTQSNERSGTRLFKTCSGAQFRCKPESVNNLVCSLRGGCIMEGKGNIDNVFSRAMVHGGTYIVQLLDGRLADRHCAKAIGLQDSLLKVAHAQNIQCDQITVTCAKIIDGQECGWSMPFSMLAQHQNKNCSHTKFAGPSLNSAMNNIVHKAISKFSMDPYHLIFEPGAMRSNPGRAYPLIIQQGDQKPGMQVMDKSYAKFYVKSIIWIRTSKEGCSPECFYTSLSERKAGLITSGAIRVDAFKKNNQAELNTDSPSFMNEIHTNWGWWGRCENERTAVHYSKRHNGEVALCSDLTDDYNKYNKCAVIMTENLSDAVSPIYEAMVQWNALRSGQQSGVEQGLPSYEDALKM